MKSKNKILMYALTLCIIIMLLLIISITYSRYRTSTNGSTDIAIARWNIKVNNIMIKDNSDLSNTITPVFLENDNINPNVIAPTSEGYFDLSIDFSEVDVSFDYEISITPQTDSSVSDLVITSYSMDNGNTKVNLSENSQTISGTALVTNANKTIPIRVYIEWDDENGTMNNQQDTLATIPENATTSIDVGISFTQNNNAT